jgi:hypothetical protein
VATIILWVVALLAAALTIPAYRRVRSDPAAPTRQVWRATTGSTALVGASVGFLVMSVSTTLAFLFPWARWGWLTSYLDDVVPGENIWNLLAAMTLTIPVMILVLPRVMLEAEVNTAAKHPFRNLSDLCWRTAVPTVFLFAIGVPLAFAIVYALCTEITSAAVWNRQLGGRSPHTHESLHTDSSVSVVAWAARRPWKRHPSVAEPWEELSTVGRSAVLTTASVQTIVASTIVAVSFGGSLVAQLYS